jgi:hypothetical protein
MNNKIEIPISDAKKISLERNYDMIIIIGINEDKSGHITTYGKNREFCKIAGFIGQQKIAPFLFKPNGVLDKFDYETNIEGNDEP